MKLYVFKVFFYWNMVLIVIFFFWRLIKLNLLKWTMGKCIIVFWFLFSNGCILIKGKYLCLYFEGLILKLVLYEYGL